MSTANMHQGNIAVVGAAETERIGTVPETSMIHLHTNAARRAIVDAGIDIAEIDGVATAGPTVIEVADMLGIRPRWADGTMIGGCSFMALVRHAASAIASGAANVVLVTHGESGRSRVGVPAYSGAPSSMSGQFEAPYGALAPYSSFTTPALAFMHARGFTREDLAEVVVSQRLWATPNERALRRDPIDIDGVLNARPIAYPFTRDMCCVVTDAGGALVLMSAERASDLQTADRAVYLLGSGEGTESVIVSQMDDLESFGPFRRGAQEAFETAGVDRSDIDHIMFYDAFAHLPLYMLEDTGFVGKGESAEFYREGHTRPGGSLPINTQGGGLSYTHSGMYGMFAIQESVRQLRGEAVVQVPNVTTSFVQGVGMMFGAGGSLVLSNRRS